ncbi:MAG: radical SAM protein [Desulfovibrionaceae bacterium]|nr:radical SAM protein [Desulfovibrionaceae bacterium]
MRVVEIFDSIDGEGLRAGRLATFIRLAGCNLRCSYCDTGYALSRDAGTEMTREEVLRAAAAPGNRCITVTGGEPLATEAGRDLCHALLERGFDVNIETNGSISVEPFLSYPNALITLDWKTPSSGCNARMGGHELPLRRQDVLKIVMTDADRPAVKEHLLALRGRCGAQIYLSPVYGGMEPAGLVDFMKELRTAGIDMGRVRMQLQLHKYVWDPQRRGV